MRVSIFILLIYMMGALKAIAQNEEPDSMGISRELDEIVVTAPENQTIGNKIFFYPTKELKNVTNNGVQLLAGLQISDLIINPATGSIERLGGGRLSIRINGRPASQTDITSLSPKDITKVEYTPNPGVRYGDAMGVIDITVKRRETGYGVSLNLLQSVNRGWGNYTGALKYTSGRSEWTLDFHSNPMWRMSAFRDNSEHYLLSDGTKIMRLENGIKAPNRMASHRVSLQHSYAIGSKLLLNTQLRIFNKNDRYISEGDITTVIGDEITDDFEREELPVRSTQIDLDVYLHWKANKSNKLYFNIIPTVMDGSNDRRYQTSEVELYSNISNRGYRLFGEGVWECRIGNGILTSGIRSFGEWNEADYNNSGNINEKSFMGSLFAEWKQTLDKIQYSIGIGGTAYSVKEPLKHDYYNANPRIYFRYTPVSWGGISFIGNVTTVSPTVNQLNPVRQQVDNYQWSEGNPGVSAFQQYDTKIEVDGRLKDISLKITLADTYNHNPIMGAKRYMDSQIVKSYYNSGYNNNFIVKAQIRLPIFIKQLNLSLEGGWHKTVSKGLNYRHDYSQPFINAQLMYVDGPWWIMLKYNTTYNALWAEDIYSTNNNMLNIGVGYTYRSATFMAGVLNPIGNISVKSRDLNAIAGFDREYQVSSTRQLFWIGITLNLYKGKKRSASQRKLNNSQTYESINNVKK